MALRPRCAESAPPPRPPTRVPPPPAGRRKCITTVQGLDENLDLKKIIKAIKKAGARPPRRAACRPTAPTERTSPSSPPAGTRQAHCCNGTIVEDAEMGQVLQFQGDQRDAVVNFLLENEITDKRAGRSHGPLPPPPQPPPPAGRRCPPRAGLEAFGSPTPPCAAPGPPEAPQRAVLRPATQLRPRRSQPERRAAASD